MADSGCARHRLRADAERNRAAILAAAREVFAEQGLAAPLEEIAECAGVGIGTLYRRFPTRGKLVAAALIDKIGQYAEAADQALAAPDSWAGFSGFVQRICELQADDRGLAELMSMSLSADEEVERVRRIANERTGALIERAKADRNLRADFVAEDLALLLIAVGGVMHVTRSDAPGAWRRFVALTMDGFQRAPVAGLPEPPSMAQLTSAMQRLAAERGC